MDRISPNGRTGAQHTTAQRPPAAAGPGFSARSQAPLDDDRSFWQRNKKLIIGLLVLAILLAGALAATRFLGVGSPINKNEYQAVFLSNGQVYFGKLKDNSGETWQIDEVYYLQQNQQESGDKEGNNLESQTQPQLIKLGQEIHKPHSTMYIRSDQVLFWENIQNDGKVAEAIKSAVNQ